ncbi:MAG: hypothetical protein K8R35_03580 [Bacteroidales bacterium]|nr:hypothetical protein [Bacteroidales bacterium]
MPYRRLPNTDAARIRAMREALAIGRKVPPFKLAYTSKSFVELQAYLPNFENIYQMQRQSMSNQVNSNKEYQEIIKKAKIYISHFLKVMNLAIQRGDLRPDTPGFYGLSNGHLSIPALSSEKDIIEWGKTIIEGEAKRQRAGRTSITNPTIAVVKVHYEKFLDAWQYQKTLHKRTADYSSKIAKMRKEADSIIVTVWNEVESTFSDKEEEQKRSEAEKYGLVYVFRKEELENNRSAGDVIPQALRN